MTPHALKMLTSFILIVAIINSVYYAVYLTYNPAFRRMNHLRRLRSSASRSISRLRIPIIKVVWLPGPNHTRIKQTMKVYWIPEYSCADNTTKTKATTITTTVTDYRDPEDYPYTEFVRGSICPSVPLLLGPTDWRGGMDPTVMERVFSLLERGGAYKPQECIATHHVAIIVPYKGTHGPLLLFLFTLHLALLKQQVEYQVFVVREVDESRALNTGKFLNIGFLEAHKMKPNATWTCFVFHDPYLAPTDARNLYRCSERPKQLFGRIDTVSEKNKFGAVIAMTPEHFRTVNGFSNLYYDTDSIYHDMYDRLIAANYTIENPSPYAKYDSLRVMDEYVESSGLKTTTTTHYPTMVALTSTVTEPQAEGLSSVSYTVTSELRLTHTLLLVGIEKAIPVPGKLMVALIKVPTNPPTSSTPTTEDSSKSTTTKKTTTAEKTSSKHTRPIIHPAIRSIE